MVVGPIVSGAGTSFRGGRAGGSDAGIRTSTESRTGPGVITNPLEHHAFTPTWTMWNHTAPHHRDNPLRARRFFQCQTRRRGNMSHDHRVTWRSISIWSGKRTLEEDCCLSISNVAPPPRMTCHVQVSQHGKSWRPWTNADWEYSKEPRPSGRGFLEHL